MDTSSYRETNRVQQYNIWTETTRPCTLTPRHTRNSPPAREASPMQFDATMPVDNDTEMGDGSALDTRISSSEGEPNEQRLSSGYERYFGLETVFT